jgi:hypothetical protein
MMACVIVGSPGELVNEAGKNRRRHIRHDSLNVSVSGPHALEGRGVHQVLSEQQPDEDRDEMPRPMSTIGW